MGFFMDIFVFTFRIFRWVIKSGSFIKCQRMCTIAYFIEGFKYFRLLHSVANSDDVYQKILNIVFTWVHFVVRFIIQEIQFQKVHYDRNWIFLGNKITLRP